MKNITVISGHPSHANSISNDEIISYLEQSHIGERLSVRKLEELHSNFEFDVEKEQLALLEADTIIFQFPIFWYSFPALMKKWFDDVICYGFAFGGEKGAQLKDKKFIFSFTIGGKDTAYGNDDEIALSIEDLVKPLKQILKYCHVIDIEHVFSHNMLYIPNMYGSVDDIRSRSITHAKEVLSMIE
ncbi:NAD(P)H-dependent oxidoreductase [Photobacterium damselae]|nr:NAD(P)H-dependent oxidoreductase [Photobacterium damselae]